MYSTGYRLQSKRLSQSKKALNTLTPLFCVKKHKLSKISNNISSKYLTLHRIKNINQTIFSFGWSYATHI